MFDYEFDGVLDEFLAQLNGDDQRVEEPQEKQDVALQTDRP